MIIAQNKNTSEHTQKVLKLTNNQPVGYHRHHKHKHAAKQAFLSAPAKSLDWQVSAHAQWCCCLHKASFPLIVIKA